jgi:hypothetical protein
VVCTCDVLGQGGRSRKRRGIGVSEDLACGRRKKCPPERATCIYLDLSLRTTTSFVVTKRVLAGIAYWFNMPGLVIQPDTMESVDSTTTAPFYAVPQERVISIEHPCIVRNFDNGVKSLGGEPQMKHVSDGV